MYRDIVIRMNDSNDETMSYGTDSSDSLFSNSDQMYGAENKTLTTDDGT